MTSKNTYLLATICKIVNLLSFTICSLLFKFKLAGLPVLQQFVLVYAGGAALLYIFIFISRSKIPLFNINISSQLGAIMRNPNRLSMYLGRGVCTAVGMLSWIEAIGNLGMTESTIISYLTPILTSIFAVVLLKERIKWNWLLALSLGGIGVYLSVRSKQYDIRLYGVSFAFLSAIAWSFYDIICKKQTQSESPIIQVLVIFTLSSILMLPFAMMDWHAASFEQMLWVLLLSSTAIFSVFMLFLAYRLAPISHLMPHSYLRLVFAVIAMYLIAGEIPNANTIIGGFMIIIANTLLFIPNKFVFRRSALLSGSENKQN